MSSFRELRLRHFLVLLALVTSVSTFVGSSQIAAASDFKLPDHKRNQLDNGMTVFIMERHQIGLVSFRLELVGGSALDPSGSEGIANLVAETLDKGLPGVSAAALAERIEFVGGQLHISADREDITINADFPSEFARDGFNTLADVLLLPVFSDEEIAAAKGRVVASLKQDADDLSSLANRFFREEILTGNPLAHDPRGTVESVERLTAKNVHDFYRNWIGPRKAILSVVGDIKTKDVQSWIEERLEDWDKSMLDLPQSQALSPVSGRRAVIIDRPDATQAQIRFGNISLKEGEPDYFPFIVAHTALGGKFDSRLNNEIRVKRGLSYGAYCRHSSYQAGGLWYVQTFTKNETVDSTLIVAAGEVEKIRTAAMPDEEIEATKNYIVGQFALDLETNGDLAAMLIHIERLGLGSDYVGRFLDGVRSAASTDIQSAARKYLASPDAVLVVVGAADQIKSQVVGFGEPEVRKL